MAAMAVRVGIGLRGVDGGRSRNHTSSSQTTTRKCGSVCGRAVGVARAASSSTDGSGAAERGGAGSDVGRRFTLMGTTVSAMGILKPTGEALASSAVERLQNSYFAATSRSVAPERYYPYWWALPIAPYSSRTTAFAEASPGELWTFDQPIGLLNVLVNVRMTVYRLESGGLWVHNPVAPTQELMKRMRILEETYGAVKHIVVGSAAIEHKIYSGPFSKFFPSADVWLPEKNWSWPANVPLSTYVPFFTPKTLPRQSLNGEANVPWADEIEHVVLEVGGSSLPAEGDPWFVDTAFFLKRTRTLVITDVMEKVSQQAPPVCQINPQPLLVRAMDGPDKVPSDTPQARSDGWGKTVLFGLLFKPAAVEFQLSGNLGKDLLDGFVWDSSWRADFDALVARDMFVPPILAVVAFPRRRDEVKRWTSIVCAWDFESVLPSHLDGPFNASPAEFTAAIDYALTAPPREQFGRNTDLLLNVEKLAMSLRTLEKQRSLSPELLVPKVPLPLPEVLP